jgi:hypothetical protein
LAENNLGALVLPEGWTEDYDSDCNEVYKHADGREQRDNPSKPEGLIAIADAIPDMRALSSLDLTTNNLNDEAASHLITALNTNVSPQVLAPHDRVSRTPIAPFTGGGSHIAGPQEQQYQH